MFATVLAKRAVRRPLGLHRHRRSLRGHAEPVDISIQRWFDHSNRGMFEERDPETPARAAHRDVEASRATLSGRQVRARAAVLHDVRSARVSGTRALRAAPDRARRRALRRRHVSHDGRRVRSEGDHAASRERRRHRRATLGYYRDDTPVLLPFTGTLDGDPIVTRRDDTGRHTVVGLEPRRLEVAVTDGLQWW